MILNFRENLLLLIIAVLLMSVVHVGAQTAGARISEKDRGKLKKEFGLILPKKVIESRRFELPKTKVIYLLVKMSKQDAVELYSTTVSASRPRGVRTAINGPECGKSNDCVVIGMVFSPSDEPDEVDKWEEENNFKNDTTANFYTVKKNRVNKYASFFMDTEKGLLMLWYKI